MLKAPWLATSIVWPPSLIVVPRVWPSVGNTVRLGTIGDDPALSFDGPASLMIAG